ncbi:MAG: JAB domain-containing protein, partial [Oscillospiraceae bacterium]|nr:JAB domain-containing protein [Oscillospiraceae bacterium]
LYLDGAAFPISCRQMGNGSVNSADVPIRNIVREALALNATGIVLAHNHPSGLAVPSQEDIDVTRRIRDSLEIMELHLLDHIVIADDDFVSIKESGFLR